MGKTKNFKGANGTKMVKGPDGKIVDNIACALLSLTGSSVTVEAHVTRDEVSAPLSDDLYTKFIQSPDMDDYAGIWYEEDADFSGLCEEINGEFVEFLTARGIPASMQDFAASGAGDAPENFAHTVAVYDGFVYDFTYRQVDPEAGIPTVTPLDKWVETWRRVGAVDGNGNPYK
jgi:hypothetical protein